jgi:sugar lactone lactonase YvrE
MRPIRLFLLMVTCAIGAMAQGTFVYTNNDRSPNSVSAFSMAANGALTPVPGSPFPTGGTGSVFGGLIAANRITTAIVKGILYAANSDSDNISAFSINPATGVLTAVAGSPFPTGFIASGLGISLATTPNDQFLITADAGGILITIYSIAANGALTAVAGSPFDASPGGPLDGIKVTPDGKFLAVARINNNAVSMYSISSAGGLTSVPGSPFPAGGLGMAAGVDCNCSSKNLFVGEANFGSTIVSVQSIDANGALLPIPGSPFVGPGDNSNVVLLSPDDSKLFVSNRDSSSVTAFNVAASGTLTLVPGSPFLAPGSFSPSGMATDQSGTFLYVADFNNQIIGFSIAANGALSTIPGSPFIVFPGGFGLLSLAVFPSKSCCPAPVISDASATPDVLWPPNHKFVEVTIDYEVTSPCPSTCVLTVSSNEPINGTGDGNTSPDWQVVDAHHLLLRAEGAGGGNGRTYTITITCTNDTNKQSSTKTVTVFVPHNQ